MTPQEMLQNVDHRPWAIPNGSWWWWQSWRKLLFAHWAVPADAIRSLIPPQLELQTYDAKAWIGVVPFELSIRPRYTPLVPGLSVFPEINVRTYVSYEGRDGVFFFSLDAANPIACWAARTTFHLPYFWARMALEVQDDIRFTSARRSEEAEFIGNYRPVGDVYSAQPDTLEHWLTERYALFSQSPDGALHAADVHHVQWPLQRAEASIELNTMLKPTGVDLPEQQPLLHYAERIDVLGWPLDKVADAP